MKRIMVMLSLMLILLLPTVAALEFGDETIVQSPTSFEWCFTPDWEDKELYKNRLELYVDNYGCEITQKSLYAESQVYSYVEECISQPPDCITKNISEKNGTNTELVCTPTPPICNQIKNYTTERYDLEKTDYLFPEGSRLCYVAHRKAKLDNDQSCDMNFRMDLDGDGTKELDVKDYGKAWWNGTWDVKYQINASNLSTLTGPTTFPYRLHINSSFINYSYFNSNGSDVRFLNSTEDGELDYVIEKWNVTGQSVVYVEIPINNISVTTFYLYGNASGVSTTSNFTDTFGAKYEGFWSMIFDATDLSDGGHDLATVGTPTHITTGCEFLGCYDLDGGVSNDGLFIASYYVSNADDFTYGIFVKTDNAQAAVTDVIADSGGVSTFFQIRLNAAGNINSAMLRDDGNHQIGTGGSAISGAWHLTSSVLDLTSDKLKLFVDGISVSNVSSVTITNNVVSTGGRNLNFGYNTITNGIAGQIQTGFLVSDDLTDDELRLFSDMPSSSFSSAKKSVLETNLKSGLYNTSFNNISLVLSEGQDFFVFANYTYTNGTMLTNTSSYCNFTANNIIDENYDSQPGINTTSCGGGCTYVNHTIEFIGLDGDGYQTDILRFKLCHNGVQRREYNIVTSCGYAQQFNRNTIPLCTAGYVDVEIIDATCASAMDVNVSVWGEGVGTVNALRLVDDFVGIDRLHNHSDDLPWNSTLNGGVWFDDTLHEYYQHGSKSIDVDCQFIGGGVENQTSSLNITVVNVPPTIIIDSVWWWALSIPQNFVNNTVTKYPLFNTINISSVVVDDDLDTIIYYLNFTNGTNINTQMYNTPRTINYTVTNFSTNLSFLDGLAGSGYIFQVWSNDTEANSSSLSRSFTARNSAPTISWLNASPVNIGVVPSVINWTCSDPEGETPTAYLTINSTLNQTGGTSHLFNMSENTYNLSLLCSDSFRNSTQSDITLIYAMECIPQFVGLTPWARYRNNIIPFNVSCSNGVTLTSCTYAINRFAPEAFVCNTTNNITLELGDNDIQFVLVSAISTLTPEFRVNAKRLNDGGMMGYVVTFIIFAFTALMFVLYILFKKMIIYGLLAVFGLALFGVYLLAFSFWIAIFVWIVCVVFAFQIVFVD